ncbi:hypothetical protein JZ751_011254 [Albula glossodonta]|uniref:Uncharacterized protein n=1 Tax=Albula glossodonta TaxID=121402 RepID=A0A8T2P4P2_9TELE|nr:hypothetical protein JZ751_011254 [Albula glossodonta]
MEGDILASGIQVAVEMTGSEIKSQISGTSNGGDTECSRSRPQWLYQDKRSYLGIYIRLTLIKAPCASW